MNLTPNKVVQPWGAGKNLNDSRDGTNTTRNFQKKRQASNMPRKKILKSCHSNPKTSKLRPKLFLSAWLNKRFKFNELMFKGII